MFTLLGNSCVCSSVHVESVVQLPADVTQLKKMTCKTGQKKLPRIKQGKSKILQYGRQVKTQMKHRESV